MKKKSSRIVALVLTLCMVFFGLPVSAFAAAEVSTAEALTAAFTDGGEYQLTSDITVDTKQNWVINGKNVVLDLNGHSITSTFAEINNYIIVIQGGGSLTINDSSEGETGKIAATDKNFGYGIQLRGTGSSFALNGGTIETTQESVDIYDSAKDTSITIAGGQLISTDDSVLGVRGSGTQVNITGGDMTSGGRCGVYISCYGNPDSIAFNMTGGTLTHDGGVSGAIQAYKGATLTIGGEAVLTSTNQVVQMQGNTVLNVEGGTISSVRRGYLAVSCSDEAVVNISEGTLTSASKTSPVVRAEDKATVTISGGTFESSSSTAIGVSGSETPTITIKGGNFNKPVDKDYLAPGVEQDNEGNVVLKENVKFVVDGAGYETLDEALKALKKGSVMEILPGEYDVTATRTSDSTYGSCFIIAKDNVTIKARDPENKPVLYGFSNKYSAGVADGGINGQDTIYVSGENVKLENLILMPLGGYPDGGNFSSNSQKTVEVTADATDFTMTGCETRPNTKEKEGQGANTMAALSGLIHVSTDDSTIKKNSFGKGTTICAGWKTAEGGKPTAYYDVDVSKNYWGAGVTGEDIQEMLDGATFDNYYVDEGMTKLNTDSVTPSRPSTTDDTPSLGYRLPYIGESTGGKNFVSDTTGNLTVNGKYQFRITSTDGHKPVMTVSNSNFTVELASQSGNDYFYVIRCAGAAGSTANVLVDGIHVVVATVGTAGVVSDTTHPFTVAQGATYQFKLTSASRPTFTGNNANFTIAYVSNSGNDWFFKVTAVGAAGASTTFSANGVVVTTATIA